MNERAKRSLAVIAALTLLLVAAMPQVGLAEETLSALVVDNDGMPQTVNAFMVKAELDPAHGKAAAVSEDGEIQTAGQLLATGQTLEVRNIEGGILAVRPIGVKGDVTGTGRAGINQLVRLSQALSGEDPLTGIWFLAGDLNNSGAIDISDLVLAAEQLHNLNAAGSASLEQASVPFRVPDYVAEEVGVAEINVAYADGETEIPYVSCDQIAEVLERLIPASVQGEVTCTDYCNGMISLWQRENGSSVELNFITGEVVFTEMSLWSLPAGAGSILDVVATVGDGTPFRRTDATFERTGAPVLCSFNDYDIPVYYTGGTGYLPLATFSDLCLASVQCPLLYNGEGCYMTLGGSIDDLAEEYYSVPPRQRSAALAHFTYRELCFAMDLLYGLKENHHIEYFDRYFETTGLAPQLLSEDPVIADTALYSLLRGYLGDNHSKYLNNSAYAGADADCTGIESPSVSGLAAARNYMRSLREEQFPDGVPAYQESGDTAYITFDSFVFTNETYTEETIPDADDPSLDTAGLIRYANEQIKRPDSPITKVVMDLSCNTGGEVDAAVFAAAWYLGDAPVNIQYTTSGAQATTVYQVDINGNGEFDEPGDTVKDLQRYCLISDVSFSCGNLVPAIFKNSEQVTLLGKQSHGGACAVGFLSAADGTLFRISSPIQLSWLYNGSLYDIDQGVAPDIPITADQHYYEREYLANYLETLLR